MSDDLKKLSPTARILFWYRRCQHLQGITEKPLSEAAQESGVPESSFYRAARELKLRIDKRGSIVEFDTLET